MLGKRKKRKKNSLVFMPTVIDYYDDQTLIFFFQRVGSVVSQEMAGVSGGYPTAFFLISSELLQVNSSEANKMKERKLL